MAGEGYFGPYLTEEECKELGFRSYPGQFQRPNSINIRSVATAEVPVSAPVRLLINQDDEEGTVQKYVEIGIELVAVIAENILSHPFVVLRRQCQVNHVSKKYHLVPITLGPVMVHLYQRQGVTTLWKGIGSVLLVRGLALAIEDFLSKITPWPKEISWHSDSFKTISQHLILKCVALVIVTPFHSASLVETVQSDIASEKPGLFDVFKDGLCRVVSLGSPQKGRMLPIWTLVFPTVLHGTFKYLFGTLIKNVSASIMHLNHRYNQQKEGAYHKELNPSTLQEIKISSQLISVVASDAVFYPLETVLHRLYLQGTRTIIDDLDNGIGVNAILTNYEGTLDCLDKTVTQEGSSGLFKGFGALVLQFSAYYALLKLTRFVFTQCTILFKSSSSSSSSISPPRPKPTNQDIFKRPVPMNIPMR